MKNSNSKSVSETVCGTDNPEAASENSATSDICDVLSNSRQLLPDNKRVREMTLSKKSGAYSKARQRLPLDVVELLPTVSANPSFS